MASAFTRLFSPSHRKRASNTSSSRRQDSARTRFPTSSTFDLRHSIPEESSSAIDPSFPPSASIAKLTVQHLNHHVSAPISDATLRRRSLALDASRAQDALRPKLPRSLSALDITSPLDPSITADASPTPSPRIPTTPPPVDDDDDFDSNPLYLQLSEDPRLAHDWSITSLALIPLARTLNAQDTIHQDDLQDPHFVALHAFAPSRLYKHQFVSVRSVKHSSGTHSAATSLQEGYDWRHVTLTATIESDQRSVTITETTHAPPESSNTDPLPSDSGSTIKRTVAIVAETTIYRTVPASGRIDSHSDQSGFQVTSRAGPPSTDMPAPSAKVRVISVDLPIVHRRGHSRSASSSHDACSQYNDISSNPADDDPLASISDLILEHVPSKRVFADDLPLLADPSVTSPRLAQALTNAFRVLFSAAHQFAASFIYVKGFDSYNAHRIRRGIWFKAWKAFEERLGSEHIARLSVEAFHRIKSLLENVVMGLVHTKMYGPIQDHFLDADLVTDQVLNAYHTFNVTLADFGVQNSALRQKPTRLALAIDALSQGLDDDGDSELDEALAVGDVALLSAALDRVGSSQDPAITQSSSLDRIQAELGLANTPLHNKDHTISQSAFHRRTPLQILQSLRATIDEIGWAAEHLPSISARRLSSSHERPPPLSTDDLLPILSYVFVRARPGRLCSMLYYARTFQLTDTATSPELQWALVTCDAVIAYLRADPLRLCRRRSSGSIIAEPSQKESQWRSGPFGANDGLSVRSLSSRSHQGSAAASLMQATNLMIRPPSATDGTASNEVVPPHSPCSPPLAVDASADHLSASGSNSFFSRHGDVSSEHVANAAPDASPRIYAEGFKVPGLPASVSSRRSSRILQQRPTSVFSLSEDGDSISLLPDTSLDAVERQSSLPASQSPSRRRSMRNRTFSSSSSSTTHNDVQIRPQIVRTIKRSQTGTIYTSTRLERTSSNGSTASSSHIHVRVVGSPPMRPDESGSGNHSAFTNASPSKSDRRRSFDSWTAFSLFSSSAISGLDSAPSERVSIDIGEAGPRSTASASKARSDEHGKGAGHVTGASRGSFSSAETGASSGWLYWRSDSNNASRRNSVTNDNSHATSSTDGHLAVTATKARGAESDDVNCQPEGVETLQVALDQPRMQRPTSVRSTSSRTSASDVGGSGVQWPKASEESMTGSQASLPGTVRQRRYRGRFLSTSSATLAVSAAPLPPQVDRSSTSTADLARPARAHRQSIGSLNALRASMTSGETMAPPPLAAKTQMRESGDVPEMIPYGGGAAEQGFDAPEITPTAVSDPLLEIHSSSANTLHSDSSMPAVAFPSKPQDLPPDDTRNTTTIHQDGGTFSELAGQA